jgi:hypothetical protein
LAERLSLSSKKKNERVKTSTRFIGMKVGTNSEIGTRLAAKLALLLDRKVTARLLVEWTPVMQRVLTYQNRDCRQRPKMVESIATVKELILQSDTLIAVGLVSDCELHGVSIYVDRLGEPRSSEVDNFVRTRRILDANLPEALRNQDGWLGISFQVRFRNT